MVIRSVPDSVSLILGRTEWPGHTALHRAKRAAKHWQQALLHQLVGHVLDHQPPREASDRLSQSSECESSQESLQLAHLVHTLVSASGIRMHTLCRLKADFVNEHSVQTVRSSVAFLCVYRIGIRSA
jgi:hypothetical protein